MIAMIAWPDDVISPARLWALVAIPLLVLAYLILSRLRKRRGIRYTNTGILGALLPKQRHWRRHVAVAMALCSLAAITVAWSQPVGLQEVPRERATVIIVVDVSLSMQANDVSPTRLDAAKLAARDFLTTLPARYNVALVTLSATPVPVLPPSQDRGAALRVIDALEMQEGTAIGDAIEVALATLSQAPQGDDEDSPAPGMIALLSDGQNTAGKEPLEGAQAAKDAEVPIYTIAYGTSHGYVDVDGKRESVVPDTETLTQIADLTGGADYTAEDADQLQDAYTKIGSDMGVEEIRTELTAQWALYSLAFAVVAALGAVSIAARWP